MPLERLGSATTPESVGRELHKLLAESLCEHDSPYCDHCFHAISELVRPVARMVLVAAMFERKNPNVGYVAIGQAFEAFTAAVRASRGSSY